MVIIKSTDFLRSTAICVSFWCLTLWLKIFSATVDAAQCFCTSRDQPCQNPICEGSWCLVGFKSDDLVQMCGTDVARSLTKCARKLSEWDEVCSCQEDFCNTFAYMRENIKYFDNDPQAKQNMQGFDTSRMVDEKSLSKRKPNKNQHLVLLLVIIPLGVGALTVCLIFLNYHCKMC